MVIPPNMDGGQGGKKTFVKYDEEAERLLAAQPKPRLCSPFCLFPVDTHWDLCPEGLQAP